LIVSSKFSTLNPVPRALALIFYRFKNTVLEITGVSCKNIVLEAKK
jgi:hypothetical protein